MLQTSCSSSSASTASKLTVLEIPASARIVAVDQVSVNTPQETIEALIRRLNEGGVTRLAVSGADALETVYLTPIAD